MKRIITFLLAFVMLFSLVACAKGSNDNDLIDEDHGIELIENKIWDKKDFDFDGYVFNILTKPAGGTVDQWDGSDIDCEEMTGNEVLDEVYKRNELIETLYNCKIEIVEVTDNSSSVKTALLGGNDDDGALLSDHILNHYYYIQDGLLMDLRDPSLSHLDLEKPWYSQTIQRDTAIANKLFFVNGDMLFTDENALWVTYFNKELARRYLEGLDLYEQVKNGEWTIDAFTKYAAMATREIVADDKMDWQDQWGYVGEGPNVAAMVVAAGYRYIEVTPDGGLKANVFDDDFQDIFRLCYKTVDKSFCLLASDITGVADIWETMPAVFNEDRALFHVGSMSDTFKRRDIDVDFGLLPLPKASVEQTEYYTWTTFNCRAIAIPYTCSNPERTSAIVEALFEESSYTLRDAYTERALKYKSTRDDESIEMLEIVFSNVVYDVGVIFYNFTGIFNSLNALVKGRNIGALSSTVKKLETPTATDIKNLLDKLGYTGA